MTTAVPPSRLVELRVEARAKVGPFVDPTAIHAAERVLRARGEAWAATVCGRSLARRSVMFPSLPYFSAGEPELLVLADVEEDRAAFDRITG